MGLDKKEVVSMFLEEGHQLDAETAEFFTKNPKEIKKFMGVIREGGKDADVPTTITLEYVLQTKVTPKTADEVSVGEGEDVVVVKGFSTNPRSKKVGVDEYTTIFTDHYELVKKMLLEKTPNSNFTSINKIQNQKEAALIVMVREKDLVDKTILVEDPTGQTSVFMNPNAPEDVKKDFESIVADDVLGVVCEKGKYGLEIKHIIWPDVPLNRGVGRSKRETRCLFLSDFYMKSGGSRQHKRLLEWLEKTKFKEIYLFIIESGSSQRGDIEEFFNNLGVKIHSFMLSAPSEILLNGVNLFLIPNPYISEWKSRWREMGETNAVVNMLKRRTFLFKGRPIIIETPPDVIVTAAETGASKENYKGTTIISTPDFGQTGTAWLVELKSREINKVDFL
jgi:hypothetical protein